MNAIEKRRRARKLTQRVVAAAIGINVSRYRRLEWDLSIRDETAVRARLDQFFDGVEPLGKKS